MHDIKKIHNSIFHSKEATFDVHSSYKVGYKTCSQDYMRNSATKAKPFSYFTAQF